MKLNQKSLKLLVLARVFPKIFTLDQQGKLDVVLEFIFNIDLRDVYALTRLAQNE